MTLDVVDAVGELVKLQSRRIHYLPGDDSPFYTVRAPCLLTQLHQAVRSATGGRGARRSRPGERIPLAADALDLWVEVTASAHAWADSLGVDRRPYRAAELAGWRYVERVPELTRRLWVWMGPPGGPVTAPPPGRPPATRRVRPEDDDPLADRAMPPIGRLLRVVAAQCVAVRADEVAGRVAGRAEQWADRIRVMLAGWAPDERIFPLRGVACEGCGARTVVDDADGERLVRPAVEVRFQVMEGRGEDDLWPYRWCLACGDAGWLPHTSETGASGG